MQLPERSAKPHLTTPSIATTTIAVQYRERQQLLVTSAPAIHNTGGPFHRTWWSLRAWPRGVWRPDMYGIVQ